MTRARRITGLLCLLSGCYLGLDDELASRDGDGEEDEVVEVDPNGSQLAIEAGDPCLGCVELPPPPPLPDDEPADSDSEGDGGDGSGGEPDGGGGVELPAGVLEDEYLVGDWDGDGDDDLAVRRDGCVYMDTDGDGSQAERELCYGNGDGEDEYLVGDWDGDGDDELAVRRSNCIVMDVAGDGGVEESSYCYGNGNDEDQYLVGDWNADGRDTVAVRRGSCAYLDLDDDPVHHEREVCYGDGELEQQYLVGDWDGNGIDELVIRRDNCLLIDLAGDGGSSETTMCYGNGEAEDDYVLGDWAGGGSDHVAVRRVQCLEMDTDGDGAAQERSLCLGNGTAMAGEADGDAFASDGSPRAADAALRFDVAVMQGQTTAQGKCPTKDTTRPWDDVDYNQCFSQAYFDLLNGGPAHYVAVGTDGHAQQIADAGNGIAYYYNEFTWLQPGTAVEDSCTGAATLTPAEAACRIHRRAADHFGTVPRFIVINEISKSRWRNDPSYRTWVVQTMAALKNDLGHRIVLASPFRIPGEDTDDASTPWNRLQRYAFIAVESYISGRRGVAMNYSVASMRARYQQSIDRYQARGVPLDRLMLIEHFGQTRDEDFGRAGVTPTQWRKVIVARAEAARGLGFAGFVSYAFGKNRGEATDTNRRSFIETYMQQALP